MEEDNKVHLNNLKKYPEFYALTEELRKFRDKMYSIEDVDLTAPSKIPLDVEVAARIFAAEKVEELLLSLGLWTKEVKVKKRTYD